MSYFRLIRPINLGVIALTQYLLYYLIITPNIQAYITLSKHSHLSFFLLVLCTILLAAGSYIINDIFDISIDKINKKNRLIVSNHITIKHAWIYYFIVSFTGFVIAFYLAYHLDKFDLLWIYPAAIFGLYKYAHSWKKQFIIGNIIVAGFSAFVACIILLYASGPLSLWNNSQPLDYQSNVSLLYFYMVFAFLTSLFREIIKDMQDIEGDRKFGVRSLPIVWGLKKTKNMAYLVLIVTILAIIYWILYWTTGQGWTHLFLIITVIFPLIYLGIILKKSTSSEDFKKISNYTKLIMLMGILYILFL